MANRNKGQKKPPPRAAGPSPPAAAEPGLPAASPEPASPAPPSSDFSPSLRDSLREAFSPWALGLLGLALSLALVLAQRYNFVLEDAYISLRYARNLYRGAGPVYNPGEAPVEGYTNFLWMLLLSASFHVTSQPERLLLLSSRIFGALLIVAVWWELLRRGAVGRRWLWLGVGLVAFHQTTHSWMSGGLETHFYSCLIVLAMGRLLREEFAPESAPFPLSAFLMPLVLLTRPDGYIVGLVCGALLLFRRLVRARPAPGGWMRVALYAATCALVGGGHILWRKWYYGDWLPNTFYAKVSGAMWDNGIPYLQLFYRLNYWSWKLMAAVGAVALLAAIFDRRHPLAGQAAVLAFVAAGFTAFLGYTGGDLFEFRLLSPVVPIFALLLPILAEWLSSLPSRFAPVIRARTPCSVAASAFGVAILARLIYTDQHRDFSDDLAELHRIVSADALQVWDWEGRLRPTGQWLHEYAKPDERLGVYAAGIMPYYSDLPTLDYLGLSDKRVSRMKLEQRGPIGHEKVAPDAYIRESKVVYSYLDTKGRIEDFGSALADPSTLVVLLLDGSWMSFRTYVDPAPLRSRLRQRGAIVYPGPGEDPEAVRAANSANWEAFEARARIYGGWPSRPQCALPPAAPADPKAFGEFDSGSWDGWQIFGDGFTPVPKNGATGGQVPLSGEWSGGLINTFDSAKGDAATGSALSPPLVFDPDESLEFAIGGGAGIEQGVALLVDGIQVKAWSGQNSENLVRVRCDLAPFHGKEVRVKAYDHSAGPWGHVLADHFRIVKTASP